MYSFLMKEMEKWVLENARQKNARLNRGMDTCSLKRQVAVLEKPHPPQVISCSLIQSLAGSRSLCSQAWAFGQQLCSQAHIVWLVEQLAKLSKERAHSRQSSPSRESKITVRICHVLGTVPSSFFYCFI